MTFLHALLAAALLAFAIDTAESCQGLNVGCSSSIPCCAGLKCDLTSTGWGFCHASNGKAPAPAPVPAPKPPPAPAPKPPPAPAPTSGTYSGDGTFYAIGLGACGQTNSDSELVAAVPKDIYGVQANPNNAPVCGRCAQVNFQGKSVKVQVVDKCDGCKSGDIDMSITAFQKIANKDLGRIKVTWSFVNC